MTRIAIAGLGYWGLNLARNFDELAELTWLCDLATETLITRFGCALTPPGPHHWTDFAELLAATRSRRS